MTPQNVRDAQKSIVALTNTIQAWIKTINDGDPQNLIGYMSNMAVELQDLQARVRTLMPIEAGGFGGRARLQALSDLKKLNVEVYETEGGYFGFTGCDADQWEGLDDAINAAMREHPQAFVPLTTLPLLATIVSDTSRRKNLGGMRL